jgi:hypothetical protein
MTAPVMPRPSGTLSAMDDTISAPDRLWRRLPVVDRSSGDLSLTRCLCVAYTALIWVAIVRKYNITWPMFWLSIAVLAAAFGKSTFGFFLTKVQLGTSVTETKAITKTDGGGTAVASATVTQTAQTTQTAQAPQTQG